MPRPPTQEMDEGALASCIAWAAPGFEIGQSIYPGWRFDIADTVAAGGLHGRLLVGERLATSDLDLSALPALCVRLLRECEEVEAGVGSNAMGGPLSALRHLVVVLADDKEAPTLVPG